MEQMDSFPFWSHYKSHIQNQMNKCIVSGYADKVKCKNPLCRQCQALRLYIYSSLCSLVPILLVSLLLLRSHIHVYLRLPGVIHKIIFGVHSYYVMLRASGKTASATLVHQNQLFHIITVIILLDYIYIVHLMYLHLHICIWIDFGNKYISIYLSIWTICSKNCNAHILLTTHSNW